MLVSIFPFIFLCRNTSLELDFDAIDDEDELSESGEHKTSSLSAGSASPPLPSSSSRGLTDSGTSYSNPDSQSGHDFTGSRDNLSARQANESKVRRENGVSGVSGSNDSTPLSPTGGVSLSLGSLDLDFDFPSSFGLGTISEGRSLMNIPTTISEASRYDGSDSTPTSSGQTSSQEAGTGGLQRSISQQPLQALSVSDKGQNLTYQPQKKPPPQTAPKPRRGNSVNQGPPPTIFSSLQRNGQLPPLSKLMAPPAMSKTGRQSSQSSERMSPQQARKEMMKSTPALFPSPPRSRRNTDSLPRPNRVMTPLLPFQAQQELREAAQKAKQESSSGKKSSNGVIPHITPGSPILLRRNGGGSSKQTSPPLSSYRGTGGSKHSPLHGQRNSPTSSRLYPAHLSPGGMKGSSSMTRLAPSSSYSSTSVSRSTHDESSSTMSRNSSMDSGIQYISEGETGGGGGGGATSGERASNTSTTTTDSIATTTSLTSAGSVVVEQVGKNEDTTTATMTAKKEKVEVGGLGDFSDVLSVLSNW